MPRGVFLAIASAALAAAGKQRTPPMGWMSWEIFRCEIDCVTDPTTCISENLYKAQTDALVSGGYFDAGYNGIHIDDCSPAMARDPTTHQLVANATRFPSGMKALGDYMHASGVKFAYYTAESYTTCEGYPASRGYEQLDAQTFASWGVDYLKVDGCGDLSYYPTGYAAMGQALANSGRDIIYSCSWPAYIGDDETVKPFPTLIADGCNLWRNWNDIQCEWSSLASIIEHWGQYGWYLQQFSNGSHVHDPDMLLIGNDCITDDEARTQMAIWSINAAPLIMGNDLRTVSNSSRAILLNPEAIAVDQDEMVMMGLRLYTDAQQEVWARNLTDGSMAVALFNKGAAAPLDITMNFSVLGWASNDVADVRDIWAREDVGSFTGSFTGHSIPVHGTGFYRVKRTGSGANTA